MTNSQKNASEANNSTTQARQTHETGIFPKEFINHTRNLRDIRNYFSEYGKKFDKESDLEQNTLSEIEHHLSEVVDRIGDMVAMEFKNNVYFGKEVEHE